jgi:RNA polymerase sigma-70 factor, ECF subfamily
LQNVGAIALNEPLSVPSDELTRARAGDLAAFGRLIAQHEKSVYSLALRMLGAADLAEDMAQEVFMKLHAKLSSIESHDHLRFWLRRVTTHRAIDYLRRHAQLPTTSLEDAPPLGVESSADPLWERQLPLLLASLAPAARAVVTLRFQEDLDPVEIAKMLDMPINTVKSHLKRSLDTLRQKLQAAP